MNISTYWHIGILIEVHSSESRCMVFLYPYISLTACSHFSLLFITQHKRTMHNFNGTATAVSKHRWRGSSTQYQEKEKETKEKKRSIQKHKQKQPLSQYLHRPSNGSSTSYFLILAYPHYNPATVFISIASSPVLYR